MNPFHRALLLGALAAAIFFEIGPARAADPPSSGGVGWSSPEAMAASVMQPGIPPGFDPWSTEAQGYANAAQKANETPANPDLQPGFYVGADFLFVRPHFSEATAFARGAMSPGGLNVAGQELDFDYQASLRAFVGYRFEGSGTELQFTYTRLPGSAETDASNPGPGHFIVDPFGNVVGSAVVVNPNSALFGQTIVGGDHIHTDASVGTNVYDLEVIKPFWLQNSQWILKYSLGVRIADVSESYNSTVYNANGSFFAGGGYTNTFTGAGPRVGLQAVRYFDESHSLSLYANTYGSILVGDVDEQFAQVTTAPAFRAGQSNSILRVIPVVETELGAAWSPYAWLKVSTGWLFQAWFDLGASGGTFGGFYTVTQNSNIMAFEGLVARAQVTF